jgi:Zn-dependent peptidase ImmA (M78 family)
VFQRNERYDNEAAKIRKRCNFSYTDPLSPYVLADSLNIKVVEPKDISGVTPEDLQMLRSLGSDWSGLSFSYPDGPVIVILNPYHDIPRKNISLMEEICHHIFHHEAKVRVHLLGFQKINFLEFSKREEKDAYHIGAAVLVPYKALELLVKKRSNIEEISSYFGVSLELVKMRLQVTNLLRLYKAMQSVREVLERV